MANRGGLCVSEIRLEELHEFMFIYKTRLANLFGRRQICRYSNGEG
jgi:hypothetical protein